MVTIGINATLETVSPLDMAEGQVGPEQVEALDAILGNPELRDIPKLVYLHFHPYEQRLGMELLDSQELLDCLRNRVSVLCVGHSHRQEVIKDKDGLPWMTAAGSLRETDGYLVIRIAGGAPARVTVQEFTINQNRHLPWFPQERTPTGNDRFAPGDVLIVWNLPQGQDGHVCVVIQDWRVEFGENVVEAANHGPPGERYGRVRSGTGRRLTDGKSQF